MKEDLIYFTGFIIIIFCYNVNKFVKNSNVLISIFKYLFQRLARRDKKAFLSDQCKEMEENNGMGKTRDLLKKIRDTKGTFHAKVGTIKDSLLRDRYIWIPGSGYKD